jgi:hypothetical protein
LKFHINPVVIETFARLHGAMAFLETMNDGVPAVEEKERRYLQQLASEGSWGYGDYAVERDILDQKFHSWIPTFAAYSVRRSNAIWKSRLRIASRASSISELMGDPVAAAIITVSWFASVISPWPTRLVEVMTIEP